MISSSFLQKLNQNEDVLYQPNLVRQHHALRSPINSERINLEIGLMRYDISVLYARLNNLDGNINGVLEDLSNGDKVLSFLLNNNATPSNRTIESIYTMLQRLERISLRLESIEKGL